MFKKENLHYYLILAGLCFLAYANTLNNAFVFDDISAIVKNPSILQPFKYWDEPSRVLNSLCYLAAGPNTLFYHLINIILHSLNTILVFLLLCIFFGAWPSFLGACLFALHPIHTEAVSWISGKPYIILSLFILGNLLLYYYATNPSVKEKRPKTIYYLFSLLNFTYFIIRNYGFYFTFPLFLVLLDVSLKSAKKNWKLWIPFFCIDIARLLLLKVAILNRISAVANITGGELMLRANPVIKLTLAVFSHLWLLLFPVKLTVYHEPVEFSQPMLYAGIIALTLMGLLMPFIFKKERVILFGIALFILFFAPVYGPFTLTSLVAERYIYFPSVSLSIFAAFFYEKYTKNRIKKRKIIALVIFLLLMFAYAIRSIVRNRDWKDPESFWSATAIVSYKSPGAFNGMGLVYQEKGEIRKAIDSFEKAIRIQPKYANAYNNLGNIYSETDNINEAEELFKKAIEINPKYLEAYNNLGNIYSETGRKKEAVALYRKVIEINPEDPDAYYNLGNAYSEIGRGEEAVSAFKRAIEINPRDFNALSNLGAIYAKSGRIDAAAAAFKKAIQASPDYAPAYFNLCRLFFENKQYGEAISNCDKALDLGYNVTPDFLKQLNLHRGQ